MVYRNGIIIHYSASRRLWSLYCFTMNGHVGQWKSLSATGPGRLFGIARTSLSLSSLSIRNRERQVWIESYNRLLNDGPLCDDTIMCKHALEEECSSDPFRNGRNSSEGTRRWSSRLFVHIIHSFKLVLYFLSWLEEENSFTFYTARDSLIRSRRTKCIRT